MNIKKLCKNISEKMIQNRHTKKKLKKKYKNLKNKLEINMELIN